MRMPAEIRAEISDIGGRSGVCCVISNGRVVRLIVSSSAHHELPYMFRKIPEYDSIRWTTCHALHMLDSLAWELQHRYRVKPQNVLRPKKFINNSE
jgi:hypothetical protein